MSSIAHKNRAQESGILCSRIRPLPLYSTNMTNLSPHAFVRAGIRYANIQSDSIEDNEARGIARPYNKQGISFKQKGSIVKWPDWCSNYQIQELGTFKHDSYADTNRPKD